MPRSLLFATTATLIALATPAPARQANNADTFVERFDGARTQLDAAEAYIRQEHFAEAVDLLQKLIDTHGDRLVAMPQSPNRHVLVGQVVNARIARLPAEGLAEYRKQVDPRSRSLWQRYEKTGDAGSLAVLVTRYPNSAEGAKALNAAGDASFADGRWAQACCHWASILPADLTELWPLTSALRTGNESRLVVRSVEFDLAPVAAKWIAGLLFLNENVAAEKAAVWFAARFPNARGRLGGVEGRYRDLLGKLSNDASRGAAFGNDSRWPTFAGNAARNRVFGKPLEIGDVQHSWPLDDVAQRGDRRGGSIDDAGRSEDQPPIHPVVDGNQIVVATDRFLRTMHLDTGKAENWHDFQGDQGMGRGDGVRQRYTLTMAGDRLFVRTGQESEPSRPHRWMVQMPSVESKLYCFDFKKQRLLWEQNAREVTNNTNYLFEGPPIVDGSNAYVGMTRIDAMAEANVVCLDVQTGRAKWRTVVCEASNEPTTRMGLNHGLLTLGDGRIFYCTNLGAIAALDASTGKLQWIVTYNRGKRAMTNPTYGFSPDVNPCIYDRGRLFVAPGDSLSMYCLHAETGRQLWENQWPVAHLLGVGQGNLIVTGNRVLAIDVTSGKVKWYWPQNTTAGYGRGILAGDFVYWPTKTELHVLEQSTGQKARPTIPLSERFRLRGGNLVAVGSNLIVAQSDRIVAMAPYSRLIKRLQAELVKNDASAPLHYQLADAAAANDDFATAATHFAAAIERAKPTDKVDGESLTSLARSKLVRVHMAAAEHHRRQKLPDLADAAHAKAFEAASAADKLTIVFEIVNALEKSQDFKTAASWLARVCREDSLAKMRLVPAGRTRVSGATWAAGRLRALDAAAGNDLLRDMQNQAKQIAARESNPERLRSSLARFAATPQAPTLALEAALGFEKAQRMQEAAQGFALAENLAGPTSNERLEAMLGQARCFERSGLEEYVRSRLQRVAAEFGERPMPVRLGHGLVRDFVESRLGSAKANRPSKLGASSNPTILSRVDEIPADERVIRIEGESPVSNWMAQVRWSNGMVGFHLGAGKQAWEAALGKAARWAQFGPAGLLVGAEDRVVCFGYESGNVAWETLLESDGATATAFARYDNYVLVSRRNRLLALNAYDGQLIWEFMPESGAIDGGIRKVGDWAAIVTASMIAVVDPRTGQPIAELPRLDDTRRPALAIAGSRIVYAADVGTLAAFDTRTGAQAWTVKIARPSTDGAKLLAADGKLFLLQDGYELSRLDIEDGREIWRKRIAAKPQRVSDEAMCLVDGKLYLGAEGWLEARSTETGEPIWNQLLPESFNVAIVGRVGDAMVYGAVSENESMLIAVDVNKARLAQVLRFVGTPAADPFQLCVRHVAVVGRSGASIVSVR